VGPIEEIPQEYRKGERTHSFKIVTTVDSTHCGYKSPETARNAHNAIAAMMRDVNPKTFPHGDELVDATRVVSVGDVVALKTPRGEHTHAVIVTVETADEKNAKVWLKFRSEEKAKNGRMLVRRLVTEAAGGSVEQVKQETKADPAAQPAAVGGSEADLPF
jgi:hypothetical protein